MRCRHKTDKSGGARYLFNTVPKSFAYSDRMNGIHPLIYNWKSKMIYKFSEADLADGTGLFRYFLCKWKKYRKYKESDIT